MVLLKTMIFTLLVPGTVTTLVLEDRRLPKPLSEDFVSGITLGLDQPSS